MKSLKEALLAMAAGGDSYRAPRPVGLCLSPLVALALLAGTSVKADDPAPPAQHQITVMSYNVYHGVDLEIFRVPGATSVPDLLSRVAAVYMGYQARNFPERAQALAAEIAAGQPALIGLQEAVLVRTGALFNPAPAENVAFDYVQLLLDALSARGLNYTVVAEIRGFDIELPSALGFDVRHTDREVILARADMPSGQLSLSNVQTGHFTTNCQIPTIAFGSLTVLRGWASVDVWSRGTSFRFVSTHLDGDCLPYTSAIQVAQAQELVNGPADTTLPVLLVGDVNASPGDSQPSAYSALVGAGFVDAWNLVGAGDGFTCCQADDLSNVTSTLSSRIDVVLLNGDFVVRRVTTMGDLPSDRTTSGLWPSDHARLSATLEIPTQ
jgi:endonuclease/exonuclease/phosphatase family metal-dependent hydrolase